MTSFYSFSDPQAEAPRLVGSKAASLALLHRWGYQSVPGFIAAASLWPQVLSQIDWEEPLAYGLPPAALRVNADDSHQLQSVAKALQGALCDRPLPQSWRSPLRRHIRALQASTLILRPSLAVEGMRVSPPEGLLRSQLAPANLESVSSGMKAVWAQLFGARSLFYWQRMGVPLTQVRLAIIIQPLMPAIASGHLDLSGTQLTLQSVHGLGYALALGEALPDRHHVDLATDQVATDQVATDQVHQTQESAIQQTHAYWLDPDGSSTAESPGLLTDTSASLRYRPCPHSAALSPAQRQRLVALGRSVAKRWRAEAPELSPNMRLDWLICNVPGQGDSIYLTQLTPQPSPARAAQAEEAPTAPCPSVDHKAALPVGQRLASPPVTLAGLGASPGQVRGRVYQVSSPRDWIPHNAILLARDVTADWMPLLQQAAGVVTEQGGMTSHAAILTRGLGIPAVVGVAHVTQLLEDGDVILLDGDRGSITQFPSGAAPAVGPATTNTAHRRALLKLARKTSFKPKASSSLEYRIRPVGSFCSLLPAQEASRTKLMLTLNHIDQLYAVTNTPIDGIGLLRSELMLMPLLEQQHPLQWLASGNQTQLVVRIAAHVSQLAAAVFPDPLFYRSLDLCTDEFSYLEGAPQPHERNPALGQHGAYSYSLYPELFETELAALRQVQQAGYSNLRLVLPFVRSVDEVVQAQGLIDRAQLTQIGSFQLWIMAEVPSALLLLPEYVQAGVQGIAVGSNDLAQLLFAADRSQPDLSSRFHAHPALLKAIKQLIEQAAQLGIGCSICGDLPSQHPQVIASLVEWGVDAISVPAEAAETVRQAIAAAEASSSSARSRDRSF